MIVYLLKKILFISFIYWESKLFLGLYKARSMTKKKLGILVNTDKHLKHLSGFCRAALSSDVKVSLFIMDDGCSLIDTLNFKELCEADDITATVCDHSYKEKGFSKDLVNIKAGSQFEHAIIANECDRYIVL